MKKTTKSSLKGLVVGVMITTMFMSTAFGAQVKNTIDVIFNSINITLNGEDQDISNLLYKGTTYVPVREISKMFDKEVAWDGKTYTADIYDKESEVKVTYVNDEYGFSMDFPESWYGEFEVNPYEYGLIISSKSNSIETLAYIQNHTIQEWKELNYGDDIPVPYQVLEENKEEVFVLVYPGDVNYDIENENSVKKYEEMTKDLQEGNFTFKLNK